MHLTITSLLALLLLFPFSTCRGSEPPLDFILAMTCDILNSSENSSEEEDSPPGSPQEEGAAAHKPAAKRYTALNSRNDKEKQTQTSSHKVNNKKHTCHVL